MAINKQQTSRIEGRYRSIRLIMGFYFLYGSGGVGGGKWMKVVKYRGVRRFGGVGLRH